jgi:hypothetical protein
VKPKITKLILSPDAIRRGAKREQDQAEQKDRLRADLQQRESFVAPDGDIDIRKAFAQRGRALPSSEIMRRLRKINPALVYEVAVHFPEIGAIYAIENRPDPITNLAPWKRHICGMPHGEVWEFHRPLVVEEEIPDADGLGTRTTVQLESQIPGWRMILLRLVQEKLITLADCETHFQVSQGRSSERWHGAIN